MIEDLTRCPMPRCALEWYLALQLLVLAAAFSVAPSGTLAVLFDDLAWAPHVRIFWVLVFVAAGTTQIAALLAPVKALQRWAAFLGAAAALLLLCGLYHFPVSFIGLLAFQLVVGEAFVFSMLRGARWTRSGAGLSNVFPPNGSSAPAS